MKLKYFKKGRICQGHRDEIGIALEEGIFSIMKTKSGIQIMEECDRYYTKHFTKKEAVEMFKEAIAWIESEEL